MPRTLLSLILGLLLLGSTQSSTAHAAKPYYKKSGLFSQGFFKPMPSYDKPYGKPFAAKSDNERPGSAKGLQLKPSAYRLKRDGTPAIERGSAKGDITIQVSRNSQKMDVYVAGQLAHTWAVSTGRKGYKTPSGAYRPTWMTTMWRSKQWNNAPMPNAVFFREGYAIHATNETGNLGRPASHGCVRLAPKNAALLFQMIRAHGEKKTRIVVS